MDERQLDQFERFRQRMAGIEAHVPDPPLPGPVRPATSVHRRRKSRLLPALRWAGSYLVLAVVGLALVGVVLGYIGRGSPMPGAAPATAQTSPGPSCPANAPPLGERPGAANESAEKDWVVVVGRLEGDDRAAFSIRPTGQPAIRSLRWARGYQTTPVGDRLALLDGEGNVVALEGAEVVVGATEQGHAGGLLVCDIRVVQPRYDD